MSHIHATAVSKTDSVPPHPPSRPVSRMQHGVVLTDEFAWLKDPNWQAVMRDPSLLDPAIRLHLESENAYADHTLAGTVPLQQVLFAEMKGRIKEDDATVPRPDGSYAYFTRYREGAQHPMVCRKAREGNSTEMLLDGDALAKGKSFFRLGASVHSSDHALLAWSADESGAELYTVRVRDLATKTERDDCVEETGGAVVWTHDCSAFYYVRVDRQHRPSSVHRHRLGTHQHDDVEVFAAGDPGFFVSLSELQARRFAAISLHDHDSSEAWLIDLTVLDAKPVLVANREAELRYDVEHHPDFGGEPGLFIRTNADGAEDFKIAWSPLGANGRARWRDVVPHRAGVYVLDFMVLQNWLIRLEREEGLPRIVAQRLAGGEAHEEHAIAFDEEAYSLNLDFGHEFATDALRFSYSSMATPPEVWDYDLAFRTRKLRKRLEIPSGHDPSAYVTRRLLAPSREGERVPISLLYRRTTPLDGSAPALILGYGAYGISIPAAFNSNRLSLVDRGFVYAIAHVRGGTEKGWRWYREGKLASKQNTFSDFAAATEFLVTQKFASKKKIVAQGGSAGGLLIGAVANQRPDLYVGPDRRSAVRRRAQHDARRHPASYPAGMAGMGEPDRRCRGFCCDPRLFPLRQCSRPTLPGDPCPCRSDRSPRHLLGAGQVGGAAAQSQDRSRADTAADQPGRRPRRRAGPLRPPE